MQPPNGPLGAGFLQRTRHAFFSGPYVHDTPEGSSEGRIYHAGKIEREDDLLATKEKSVACASLIPAVPGMFVETVISLNVEPPSTETAHE